MSQYDADVIQNKPEHVIGQQLDALSLHEIDERIQLLQAEIDRLNAIRTKKEESRETAAAFFRP